MTRLVLASLPTAWFLRVPPVPHRRAEIGSALTTLSTRSYEIVRNTGVSSDERHFLLRRNRDESPA
jgi:hypothetical protein